MEATEFSGGKAVCLFPSCFAERGLQCRNVGNVPQQGIELDSAQRDRGSTGAFHDLGRCICGNQRGAALISV